MNRKFVRISLGGVRDEAEIRGHRRTYIGAIPGRIVQALKQAGAMNPVFMLDEIDKISVGFQGDPAAALLEVLDPAQNHSFRDHYLEINVDLSRVLFIATSNQLGTIHPALLDRMEIITLTGYSEEEKLHIARRYLVPRQLEENGLTADAVSRSTMTRSAASSRTTRAKPACAASSGRSAPCAARSPRASPPEPATPAADRRSSRPTIPDFLGPPRFHDEVSFRVSRPGVATGVAWTETGGDVLFVEASLLPSGHHESDPHRPAGQRHAGVGAGGGQPHPRRGRATGRVRRVSRHTRSARARAGGRDSQGRSVGGRHDGDRHRLGAAQSDGPRGRRDDGRNHARAAWCCRSAAFARRHWPRDATASRRSILPALNQARPRRTSTRSAKRHAIRPGVDPGRCSQGRPPRRPISLCRTTPLHHAWCTDRSRLRSPSSLRSPVSRRKRHDHRASVKLTSRVRGTPLPSNVYQPRSVANHDAAAIPEIRNVVVYLKGVDVHGRAAGRRARRFARSTKRSSPRVVAVTRGSTVDFPNADPFFHNVFSLSSASTFDLGRYPMGRRKSATFTKPGLVKVYCHIHSQMSASILVLDHPYFAMPDLDGRSRCRTCRRALTRSSAGTSASASAPARSR